ncbi:MAG: hypothetical protein Q8L20_14285 [Gammaproteobacteria bacterium]|nr:hypothetical protein [Gammaproteobacteria bacterium]
MGRSSWIFAGIMLLLLLVIAFVIGIAIGAGSQGEIIFTNDTLSAWVSALATVCIAVLTIFLAKETWALRQVQLTQIEAIRKDSIKPNVTLYLRKSSAGFNLPNVHILNNGKGGAQNIKFKFSNRNPDTADVYEHITEYFYKLSMIKNGISSLGPGESRISYIFSFFDLHGKLQDRALTYTAEIDIDYEDYEGMKFHSRVVLDFSEYNGVSEIGGDAIEKMSSSLEKIQKDVSHFATGFKKLKTDVYTSEDREKHEAMLQKRFEEQNAGKGN